MRIALHKIDGNWVVTLYGITFAPDIIRFSELPNLEQCINMYAGFLSGNVFIGWIPIHDSDEIWIRHLC